MSIYGPHTYETEQAYKVGWCRASLVGAIKTVSMALSSDVFAYDETADWERNHDLRRLRTELDLTLRDLHRALDVADPTGKIDRDAIGSAA